MVIYNHIIVSSCDLIFCLDRKKNTRNITHIESVSSEVSLLIRCQVWCGWQQGWRSC